jgi:hypothetical protein
MGIIKARETKKLFDQLVKFGLFTDEDLLDIQNIMLERLKEVENGNIKKD